MDGKCGKSIKSTDSFCPKVGCNKKVDQEDLENDFNIRVVIFDVDENCHSLTSFKRTLLPFMTDIGSTEDRLESLINKKVKAYVNVSNNETMNDILEGLSILADP